jgi:hypothetical protein
MNNPMPNDPHEPWNPDTKIDLSVHDAGQPANGGRFSYVRLKAEVIAHPVKWAIVAFASLAMIGVIAAKSGSRSYQVQPAPIAARTTATHVHHTASKSHTAAVHTPSKKSTATKTTTKKTAKKKHSR